MITALESSPKELMREVDNTQLIIAITLNGSGGKFKTQENVAIRSSAPDHTRKLDP